MNSCFGYELCVFTKLCWREHSPDNLKYLQTELVSSTLTHLILTSVLRNCFCVFYLHFVPFWLQATELNDKLSSAFTVLVKTTVDFCP